MVKTNPDIIFGQHIRNDNGVLEVNNEDKKIARKSYHEKLLNKEFAWDRKSLSQVDAVRSLSQLIDKDMVRESISKMKN